MTVYQPGKDSLVLKKYIEEKKLEGKKVLDMGTGSGIIAVKAAEKGADVLAPDINREALEEAREKAENEGVIENIEFVHSDLFENIENSFDLIIFNPPYLPGEKGLGQEEIWRGGDKGTEITEEFLEESENYILKGGEIAVILSSRTPYRQLIEDFGLEIVDKKQLWFETLFLAVSK